MRSATSDPGPEGTGVAPSSAARVRDVGVGVDGQDPAAERHGDHHRRQPDTAAAVDGHPFARFHPSHEGDRAVGGGEATAQTGRDVRGHFVGNPHQVEVGPRERHELGEGSPLGEPRLELPLADLCVASSAGAAPSAGQDERGRHAIVDLPPGDL